MEIDERRCPACGHSVLNWDLTCPGCGQVPWKTLAGQRLARQRRRREWLRTDGPAVGVALFAVICVVTFSVLRMRSESSVKLRMILERDHETGTLKTTAVDFPALEIKDLEARVKRLERTDAPLEMAQALEALARTYWAFERRFPEAELAYERALRIREDHQGPAHLDIASVLDALARIKDALGKPDEEKMLYRRAWKTRERVLGPEHVDVAASIERLAEQYPMHPSYPGFDEGVALYEQALAIRERVLGADHPGVLLALIPLAGLAAQAKQYDLAERLNTRIRTIQTASYGATDRRLANTFGVLARLYFDMGRYDEAVQHRLQEVEILKQQATPQDSRIADALLDLAYIYGAAGQLAQGQQTFVQMLKITERASGAHDLAWRLGMYAAFLQKFGWPNQEDITQARARAARIAAAIKACQDRGGSEAHCKQTASRQ